MTKAPPAWETLSARFEQQHWPQAALYVVATPIGNLMDLSLRAWYVLGMVDAIAAEDTRSSRPLLQAWNIDTPLLAAHRHNEREAGAAIIERLAQGQRIALISDAGAPAISDPGGRLVQDVRQAGFEVVVVPGPSAAIAALMASGASTDQHPAFTFLGFLPNKQAARQRTLRQWQSVTSSLVMFEAPHRIISLIEDLRVVFGDQRQVSLCRELTKRFEQTVTLSLQASVPWIQADHHREKGEYVVVLHPVQALGLSDGSRDGMQDGTQDGTQDEAWQSAQRLAWMGALLSTLSTRDAAKVMAKALSLPKDECYANLLAYAKNYSRP
jgi:16S rRNA (cytidine1402-2'-O)-methyltransferase